MWKFALLLVFSLSAAVTATGGLESRIVGGVEESIAASPHLVSLRYKKNQSSPFEHRCSGTIYSESIVLTTATCVIGLEANHIHVLAGSTYRTGQDSPLYLVEKYLLHPDYNIWFTDNDLALVKLAFALSPFPTKEIASIPVADTLPPSGNVATVSGWGTTVAEANAEYSDSLQMAQVSVVDQAECRQIYGGNRITDAMMCAGAGDTADACHGDAGGALVYQGAAVGLVSWGRDCANAEYPGVYTNLVHFKSWIESEAGKL
ncbi:trypsin eta-like [Musca domestica]|uniref:Trypsin eta-like n=1 Tax=Musca domestica TaxID=7370 RepID=A0A1I8NAF9_MUSDO|nr:trypsin eta-like [Musca domestica]XP_058979504.1 trypsin eta-like [Musca domestica]